MAQFIAFNPEVEVLGQTVLTVVNGMGDHRDPSLQRLAQQGALQILRKNGITHPQPELWYPQQSWLNAFKEISLTIGPNTLFLIGSKIPEAAVWPPEIDSIEKALPSIDVAYHLNHRIDGKILFNPETGEMTEGIGHYAYEPTGANSGRFVCNNPYPCDFDRGIIDSIAKKFNANASVALDTSVPGRKDGAEASVYLVTW